MVAGISIFHAGLLRVGTGRVSSFDRISYIGFATTASLNAASMNYMLPEQYT
jgi:hypothetical protein